MRLSLTVLLALTALAGRQVVVRYVAPPTVVSLTPASATVGSAVVIAGAGFNTTQGTGTVTFNGIPATVTSWSATSLTVTVPANATTGPVVVNQNGVSTAGVTFTVTAGGSCSPSPCISSVSGTVTNGSSITVAGAGFGATGPTVQIFDNFESGTNGLAVSTAVNGATVGTWDRNGDLGSAGYHHYDNTQHVSGSLSSHANMTVDNSNGTTISKDVTGSTDGLAIVWVKLIGDEPCCPSNWKFVWFCNPYGCNGPQGDVTMMFTGDTVSPLTNFLTGCNICTWSALNQYEFWEHMPASDGLPWAVYQPFSMTIGVWYRLFLYMHVSDTDGNAVTRVAISSPSTEGNITFQNFYRNTLHQWSTGQLLNWVHINGFNRTSTNNASDSYWDDAYVANGSGALARVELGDASTYAASKNLTICTTTSWSATSIACTVRAGSIGTGTRYLYVHDASDTATAGFPVTVS